MSHALLPTTLRLARRTPGAAVLMGMGALALVPPLLAPFAPELPWRYLMLMLLVPGFAITVPLLASALLAQNHPHAARLVPQHTPRMRRLLRGLWLFGGALMGLPFAALLPELQSSGALARCGLIGLLAAGTLITMAGARLRWWLPVLLAALPSGFFLALAPWSVLAAVAALGLPLGLWSVGRLVRPGNAAHLRLHAEVQRSALQSQQMLRGDDVLATAAPDWLRWLGGWVARWHARRLLARPSPANALSRLGLLVLGRSHWAVAVPFTLLMALLILPTQTLGQSQPLPWPLSLTQSLVGWALLPWLVLLPLAFNRAGQRGTRREQAVLALLPGLPPRRAQARAWAWHQTRSFLKLGLPVLAALLLLFHGAGESLGKPLLLGGVLAFMSLSHWADLSRAEGSSRVMSGVHLALIGGVAWLAWVHGPGVAAVPLWVLYPVLLLRGLRQSRGWRSPFPLERHAARRSLTSETSA